MHLKVFLLAVLLPHTLYIAAALNPYQAANIVEIGQTINLFGVLVDTAQYNQMGRVFTTNTSVNFDLPGVGILHGLAAVQKEISIISNVTSQHSLTTCHVDLSGPKTANATAYIVGTFFGQGPQAGQIFTVYGTYHIEMILVDIGWRIQTLTLTQTGQVGNMSIAFPAGVP